jgi:hypothetical protein
MLRRRCDVTKRNPVKEWTHAMERRTDIHSMRPVMSKPAPPPESYGPTAPGEIPAWLRRTRAVTTGPAMLSQSAEAILVLQRANKLLGARFGIDWAGAASVIFVEADRRGASPVALARVLTAGLRRDARGKPS